MEKNYLKEQFAADVLKGLSASPKYLSSKYFYDEEGSRLFAEIMQLPEYYLTKAEFEIFSTQSAEMVKSIHEPFHVIELGPGNGLKSKMLLKEAAKQNKLLHYYPIDISPDALETLLANLKNEMEIQIHPIANEYMNGIDQLGSIDGVKLIMFMGSNIGNFSHQESVVFFQTLSSLMNKGDHFLIGFDLKKDPELILAAYNDSRGVTRAFNLNLLHRINRELDANIDVTAFKHYPTYDPITGEARSYLISEKDQSVHIGYLKTDFIFKRNEAVYMEVSRKYEPDTIREYASNVHLQYVATFNDCKHYFANMLFVKQ